MRGSYQVANESGLVLSSTVCFLLQEGKLDRDLLLIADSERLQISPCLERDSNPQTTVPNGRHSE